MRLENIKDIAKHLPCKCRFIYNQRLVEKQCSIKYSRVIEATVLGFHFLTIQKPVGSFRLITDRAGYLPGLPFEPLGSDPESWIEVI